MQMVPLQLMRRASAALLLAPVVKLAMVLHVWQLVVVGDRRNHRPPDRGGQSRELGLSRRQHRTTNALLTVGSIATKPWACAYGIALTLVILGSLHVRTIKHGLHLGVVLLIVTLALRTT